MGQQQLALDSRAALAAVQKLPAAKQLKIVATILTSLAGRIWDTAENSTSAKRAEASAQLVEGVKAALDHGFKQVKALDGKKGIEVKITRPSGEEVTCLLPEGARGKRYIDLAGYGTEQLKGLSLLPEADFEAVVEMLYDAIRGMKVVDGALETGDEVLKQAHQIVTQGVRIDGGFLVGVFDLNNGGAVAGRRVHDRDIDWLGYVRRRHCALFGASSAKSK